MITKEKRMIISLRTLNRGMPSIASKLDNMKSMSNISRSIPKTIPMVTTPEVVFC
jgi:hypothetical protein